jgi:hypothetical protein
MHLSKANVKERRKKMYIPKYLFLIGLGFALLWANDYDKDRGYEGFGFWGFLGYMGFVAFIIL